MPRSWELRVRDALVSIAEIRCDLVGISLEQFAADPRRLRSLAFSLMVLGEACGAVPEDVQRRTPEVPWRLVEPAREP